MRFLIIIASLLALTQAKKVFNLCDDEEKVCPQGQGMGGTNKPFNPCWKGGAPSCPPSAPNCPFHQMRCLPFTYQPHRLCNMGKPHCPWFTKNRNDIWDNPKEFNQGQNRPQNN